MKCENCGNEHDGSYGSGRFCSRSCKCAFNAKKVKNHKCNFKNQHSPHGTWKCEQCQIIFETRSKLFEHNHKCHPIPKGQIWNKGLTKETDARVKKIADNIHDGYKSGKLKPSFLGKHHSEETKRKLAKHGGIRSHSGWGKQGRYHGFWCNSTWELAWIIYQEEHGVKFEKYYGYFDYTFKGVNHKYYPDFQLEDGTIVELKGYNSEQWQAKLASVPSDKKILVLYKKDMKPILEYVINKYDKNIENLYEKDGS